jgi:hypothetical protein
MDEKIELKVTTTGRLRTIYKDEHLRVLEKLGTIDVKRASNVEWETDGYTGHNGWTVRSAHSPAYIFLRRSPMDGSVELTTNGHGPPAYFASREEALAEEVKHFWELLPEETP